MRRPGRSKNKKYTDSEIQSYCQSVEELLTRISERSRAKAAKRKGRVRKVS